MFLKGLSGYDLKVTKYKIIDITTDKKENTQFVVQIKGKRVCFKEYPDKLINNDILLEGFPATDIRIIAYYAFKKQETPKYEIIREELDPEINSFSFLLKEKGSRMPLTKTPKEISSDKKILFSLSAKDAHRVGYLTGTEKIVLAKEGK